jgi:hypothetical protein
MQPVLVPIFFNFTHVLQSRKKGMTVVDEEIFIVGLMMVVLIATIIRATHKTVGWCLVLPPLLLVLLGTIYQLVRSRKEHGLH